MHRSPSASQPTPASSAVRPAKSEFRTPVRNTSCARATPPGTPRALCPRVAPPNPHDALFKNAFSDPEVAASLFKSQLPPPLVAHIDWDSLILVPGSFVDEALSSRHTDLLYRCKLGGKTALLYLLLEHQSTEDPWMPLRMLRYVLGIWDGWRAECPQAKQLPPVIPIVLHHGPKPWATTADLSHLIDIDDELRPHLAPYLPCMRFLLDDLGGLKDEALATRSLEVFAEITLRALIQLRDSPDPVSDLKRWLPLFHAMLHEDSGLRRLRAILEYLHHVTDAEQDAVRRVVHEIAPAKENEIMTTLAERLRQEGWKQGRQEGREEGRKAGRQEGRDTTARNVLLRHLALRFGPVDDDARARVETARYEELTVWSDRVITADSLAEVFAE